MSSTTPTAYTCAISGQPIIPPTDVAVVTPQTGKICNKRLLLTKLAENGGYDPFSSSSGTSSLEEKDLILLDNVGGNTTSVVLPPRPPSSTSFPSILQQLQQEYDTLVLELFDTRKALEETRMELSQSLYQNDAAVRVIARLAMERDSSRDQLAQMAATGGTKKVVDGGGDAVPMEVEQVPAKIESDEGQQQPPASKKARVEEEPTTPTNKNGIPQEDVDIMISKWTELNASRKKRKKLKKESGLTTDDLKSLEEIDTKNLHKSNKPGITSLSVVVMAGGDGEASSAEEEDIIVSSGMDKSIVLYNTKTQTIVGTISSGTGAKQGVVRNMDVQKLNGGSILIATAASDSEVSEVKLFLFQKKDGDDNGGWEAIGTGRLDMKKEVEVKDEEKKKDEDVAVVGVSIHPTGKYLLATTSDGCTSFCRVNIPDAGGADDIQVDKVVTMGGGGEEAAAATCSALHPDGLIVAVGTQGGSLQIWDVKEQTLASTMTGHTGPVTSINFSENGYHIATTSGKKEGDADADGGTGGGGEVIVWDLKKQKILATLNQPPSQDAGEGGEGDGDDSKTAWYAGETTTSVSFDPSGKYLAYVGERGTRITVVKEWGETASFPPQEGPKKRGKKKAAPSPPPDATVVWGSNGTYLVTGCSKDKSMKFFGRKKPEEEEEEKGGE